MKKAINILIIFSLALFATNDDKGSIKLEIYQNASFLTKKIFKKDKNSFEAVLKVPYKLSLKDIEIEEKKGCKTRNIVLQDTKEVTDEITKKIDEIEKQISFLSNKIKSLNESNNLLKTLSLEKISKESMDLQKIVEFHSSKILDNLNQIVLLDRKIEKLKEELARLRKKRESKFYKNLKLNIECVGNFINKEALSVKYPFDIKRELSYDIYADIKKKEIKIESKLFLLQSSGENLKNIDIIYASYPKVKKLAPQTFYPWYVDFYPLRKKMFKGVREKDKISPSALVLEKVNSTSYQKRETNEFYKIENVTLLSGVEKSLVLSGDRYKANFFIEIAGYGLAKPFFAFEFNSSKFYNPSYAKFYLNDDFVGRRYFSLNKKEKRKLYFGEDLNLEVEKRIIKDFKEEPLFSSNKIRTTKIFEYKIANLHNFPVSVSLVERAPVSKNEKIEIKIISKPKYSDMKPNGKVLFKFSLAPKEEKKIEFGYEIEKPKP